MDLKRNPLTKIFFIPFLEQRKKLRQLFKTDPTAATGMAFDDIVLMDEEPDKYMRLLVALKDAGKARDASGKHVRVIYTHLHSTFI